MKNQTISDSEVIEGLSIKYLKFFGLWNIINDYNRTGKRSTMLKFQLVIGLLFTVPYVLFQYVSFFFIEVDVQKFAFLTLHTLPGMQMCCEILVIWFRIDSQCRLFNLIKKDFLYLPESRKASAERILTKIGKKSNLLCLGVFLVNFVTLIFAVNFPVVSVDYILYHTGNMDAVNTGRKKIFGGWYPLPMDKTPYYEIIYVFEAAFHLWAGMLLAAYISWFYQVLMCLYAQFSILSLRLSSLKVEKESIMDGNVDSKIYQELYLIIQQHKKLLSYSNELRSVYNPLVTLVLGIGIIILISAVFRSLFGTFGNPISMFLSLMFFAYQGIEVCMFCFGSSYVETASSDLQFAIYSSDWYKADIKFRKAAQMMMMRAKKGVTLTAIRMYPINLETMMSIFQFTYTVSTLMSRMM